MAYFDRFPLMAYDVAGNENYKLLPNILKRVKLRSGLRSGSFLFDSMMFKMAKDQKILRLNYTVMQNYIG